MADEMTKRGGLSLGGRILPNTDHHLSYLHTKAISTEAMEKVSKPVHTQGFRQQQTTQAPGHTHC
eukprot:scaffold112204_cov31-Attheya_sp.AAC.1